jgi:hypothetical protein
MHGNPLIRRMRTSRADERGGVVLVVILMSVASMLVLITLSSVSSGLTRVSDDQMRSNAFQFANAGIDQALYRIDTTPPTAPSSVAAGSYTPAFTNGASRGSPRRSRRTGSGTRSSPRRHRPVRRRSGG